MKQKVFVIVRRHGAKRSEVFGEDQTDAQRYAAAKAIYATGESLTYESIVIIVVGQHPKSRALNKPTETKKGKLSQ